MTHIVRYIFLGALALIPLFIVVQVVLWVNKLSFDFVIWLSYYTNSTLISALIIILSILILGVIGYSTEKFGKSIFISLIDIVLEKIPAIRTIYSIVKKITKLFMTSKNDEKKEVVLVEYPKDGLWVPAYVLSKYKKSLVLFIPTSPNPTSGYTVIVNNDIVKSTTLTVGEASQFIVSMGADYIKKEELSKIIMNENKI
jgi:uncharacterized membrane protein